MGILRKIKEFLFPKMYSGLEIAEMGKSIKFDYFPDAVDIIYKSDKLTDNEKRQFVDNLIYRYTQNKYIDKKGFEYIKSKLEVCKVNLDKRLTHNPFTIFDVEECKKYIGKEGFFADNPYDFEDLKKCGKGTLTHLAITDGYPFTSGSCDYKYFYPKEELED